MMVFTSEYVQHKLLLSRNKVEMMLSKFHQKVKETKRRNKGKINTYY